MYSVSRSGWSSAPRVPATQCGGQLSTKSGSSEKCAPGIDMPVLGGHDVVELAVVGVDVLADGPGELRPALDGQGAAFAEIVLDVDDDQGAGHQFSS